MTALWVLWPTWAIRISDQTVGNILKRHSIPPAPERKNDRDVARVHPFHLDVLLATDFFTNTMWTWLEVVLACILLCLHVGRRTIHDAGTTALHYAWRRLRIVPRSFTWYTSVARWICAVTEQEVSRLPQGGDRVRCLGLSACTTHTSHKPFLQSRGTVVRLPVGRRCQIRDGPLRRQQRLGGLLLDANREAA